MEKILDVCARILFPNYYNKLRQTMAIEEAPRVFTESMSSDLKGSHEINFRLSRELQGNETINVLWQEEGNRRSKEDGGEKESHDPLKMYAYGRKFRLFFNTERKGVRGKDINLRVIWCIGDSPPMQIGRLPSILEGPD